MKEKDRYFPGIRGYAAKMTPVRMIAAGYFLLIAAGTLLLWLPVSTRAGETTGFMTALFTAASASCVTGLVVADTGTHWTVFGQTVILIMIQVGGLGFVTVGVLFALFFHRRINLKARGLLQESLNISQVGGIVRLAKKALAGTALIEAAGAILLTFGFIPRFGVLKGLRYGIFHSISAFCNAGFDLMGESCGKFSSLSFYSDDFYMNTVLWILIITGGIGFTVWDDITKQGIRARRYTLHTKLALTVTGILLFGGACLFRLFEGDGLMAGMSRREAALTSVFSSVTARTAGFNTIDTAELSDSSKLLTMFLMFVGGSPGSTAGGIKTTTWIVLLIYVWSNLKHTRGSSVFGRSLEEDAIRKASSVAVIHLLLASTAAMIICRIQPLPLSDVLFEVFSAIGTVGMSTGITRELTIGSQAVIILLMYCGRIGGVALALSFLEKKKAPPVKYPAEKVMIG